MMLKKLRNLTSQDWPLSQYRDYWRTKYFDCESLTNQELFCTDLDCESQKELFKAHIEAVWVEFSSYCNRRCSFCPNADGNRIKNHHLLDVEIYRRILSELKQIKYNGRFALHEYNEPLAEPSFFDRLEEAFYAIPNAFLFLTTNGDYITKEIMLRLSKLGIKQINISIYGPGDGRFEDQYIVDRILELEHVLQIVGGFVERNPNVSYVYNGEKHGMSITMRGNNLSELGFDRGGLIQNLTPVERRKSPCYAPFKEFHVTWEGLVKPCCNIYPEKIDHHDYATGDLHDGRSIFQHYSNSKMVRWRKDLDQLNPGPKPCRGCSWPWINV